MGLAVHREEVEKLLGEWADNPKEAGNIINCLIEFMAGDLYWLADNIRTNDRVGLIELAKQLTPNV